jgi:large subunit ribosomal protein L17
MRHNNKVNHLGRTYSHRDAMLSNMACSLIKHKRIFTTVPKAKELRKYVEPIITKCKKDSTHSRRMVFKSLRDKYTVTELFKEVSQKVADRPGGYTRIIKTGYRLGDNAAMCFIELVDYNENMAKTAKVAAKPKTRRSRSKKAENVAAPVAAAEEKVLAVEEKEPKAQKVPKARKVEETPKAVTPEIEKVPEVEETKVIEETPVVETPVVETPVAETPAAEIEVPAEETKNDEIAE